MNHLFCDPWVFLPSSLICTFELWRSSKEELEWKFEWVCEKCEDWNQIQEFWFPTKILISNKLFKVSKTWRSLLKWLFDKLSYVKPVWQTFLNSLNCIRLIFHLDCEEHIFDRISRNTYPNRMGLVSLWSRSENLSYELKLIFSSFWRNFIDRAWIRGCLAHVHQIR